MAIKYMERIALDEYSFSEVHADTFDELLYGAEKIKKSDYYKDRIHNPKLIDQAKEVFGNTPQNFTANIREERQCAECGAPMRFKEGNKNGRTWRAYFCTDKNKQCKPVWL